MKLKQLLLFFMAVWMFAGCTGESAMITVNYYFVNATDKTIDVEAYDDDGHNPIVVHYSFSILPNSEVLISGKYFPGRVMFFPFTYSDYIRISNGEKTVIQIYGLGQKGRLFTLEYYEEFSCKRKGDCYRYTFTEEDFKDVAPVTE